MSTLALGTPRASATGFELPLEAPQKALRKLEKHYKNHRIVLFVPGVTAAGWTETVERGPVSQL